MVRKIIISTIFVLLSTIAFSQNISVSSFRCIEEDISARVANVKDINGELCALIIVNTPVQGFEFSVANIEKTEQKTGEIWIYISPGSRFITLKHRDLGSLRNYNFPQTIESGKTYEMVLKTAKITQTIEESITEQYLVIKSATPDAKIFVNNEFLGKQSVTKYLSIFNEHSYRVEAPLHHTKEGKVKLNSETKTTLQVDLDPAYGYLKVNTTPESGAEIEINGKSLHQTTPCTSDKLESGKYTVQAFKPMYKSEPQRVDITDGKTTEITINLIPTFANAEITCQDKDVEIYIDGDFKAKGSFKGQLSEGVHRLEVKKKSHRSFVKSFTVMSGQNIKETIDVLSPINGKLNINSTPFEADIYIDGKHYGKTPNIIPQILIGDHQLTLKKDGFKDLQENIKIEEGKIAEYNFTLQEQEIKLDRRDEYIKKMFESLEGKEIKEHNKDENVRIWLEAQQAQLENYKDEKIEPLNYEEEMKKMKENFLEERLEMLRNKKGLEELEKEQLNEGLKTKKNKEEKVIFGPNLIN